MPERPDLRKIATDIREALESYPREALVDILTYVFQAYVVEGAPAMHAPQTERLAELEGLSFAELVTALQTRLDVPELALFEVSAGRVSVRAGGELVPLQLGASERRAPAIPLSPPAEAPAGPAPAAAPPSRPAPAPAAAARPAPPAETPRPRGLSVNPGGGPGGASPRPGAAAAAPNNPGQPTQPARPANTPEDPGEDDAASKRFRLLEID